MEIVDTVARERIANVDGKLDAHYEILKDVRVSVDSGFASVHAKMDALSEKFVSRPELAASLAAVAAETELAVANKQARTSRMRSIFESPKVQRAIIVLAMIGAATVVYGAAANPTDGAVAKLVHKLLEAFF